MGVMHKSLVVLALLVGCGDDGVHKLPDAPPAPDDASIDAPTTGAVTLTILQDGNPQVAIDVFFLAADNSLVAKVATNAQGVASATMGLGGSVTVIDPFLTKSSVHDVRTFAGVKPGDNLRLTTGNPPQSVTTNFTLTLPADAAASSYEVHTSCGTLYFSTSGSGSGGTTVGGPSSLYGCGATIDLLLQTFDFNGQPVGSIYKAGVALTEGGTIDLSAMAYTTPVPTGTINWSNVPAGFTEVDARAGLATSKGLLRTDTLAPVTVTAGAGSTTFARPAITGGIAVTQSQPFPTNGFGRHSVYDWSPQGAGAISIDFANALLGTYSTMPSVSAATRTVTWAAGAGASPDFAWATLRASRVGAMAFVGGTTLAWDWSIVVPYGSTTFTLPLLPAEIAQYNFVPTDAVNVDDLITAKVPGGYDAVRATILSSSGPLDYVTSATGRIVLEGVDFPVQTRTAPRNPWTTRPLPARK